MSGGGTPYIGSKISLISKAKIRYEGYLYTIDTEESTVTLAKVKSYGTEDRKAPNKVPERNEIYEYIVFRGSDIDDLHVAACPKSNQSQVAEDPAIVQTGNAQPNMYQQQMPMQMGTPFPPHQNYGPFGGMPYGYPIGFRPQGNMPLSSVIGSGNMGDSNTRSSPFDRYRQSPSPPSAGPVGSRYRSKERGERSQSPDSAPGFNRHRDSQHSNESQTTGLKATARTNQQSKRENASSKEHPQNERQTGRKHSKDNNQQKERHMQTDTWESKEQGRNREKDHAKSRENSRNSKKQAEGSDSSKNRADFKEKEKQRNLMEGQKHRNVASDASKNVAKGAYRDSSKEERSDNENARGHMRGRTRGRSRGRGAFNKTRFEKDFDFERANAKFNKEEVEKELLSALKKNMSLKDEDDVIVEDGHREAVQEEVEPDINDDDVYYDKSKSFFDQISCDSVGPSGDQVSRRKERALNVETFGAVPWNYRGRPYRGRGGRGRGRGYGRNGRRGGRGSGSRGWVDYKFDFEAAGIRQGGKADKSSAS